MRKIVSIYQEGPPCLDRALNALAADTLDPNTFMPAAFQAHLISMEYSPQPGLGNCWVFNFEVETKEE